MLARSSVHARPSHRRVSLNTTQTRRSSRGVPKVVALDAPVELAAFVAAPVVLGAFLLGSFKIEPGKGQGVSRIASKSSNAVKVSGGASKPAGKKSTSFSLGTANTRKTDAATSRVKGNVGGGTVTVYRRSSF